MLSLGIIEKKRHTPYFFPAGDGEGSTKKWDECGTNDNGLFSLSLAEHKRAFKTPKIS